MAVTATELLKEIRARLVEAGVTSPLADARWIMRHVLEWSPVELTLGRDRPVDDHLAAAIRQLAVRRAQREPLQLVLGGTEFGRVEVELRAGVFVPRPETELLAELASERVSAGDIVVEPCTGSGAVACAIAAEQRDARVLATDRDGAAVALARRNAERLGLAVEVFEGWLLEPLPPDLSGAVDVIVANPPYLADGEVDDLEPEVAVWDPRAALVAGPTGHEVSDELIAAARTWLKPGGWLLLEHDERRIDQVADRVRAAGLRYAAVAADLAGRPRFVVARKP